MTTITGRQIRDESITGADIQDGSILKSDLGVGVHLLHGFPTPYAVTLTYTPATRTVTLTPIGASFDVWLQGVRHTQTGAQSVQHGAGTGNWYVVFGPDGGLSASQTPWKIDDSAATPVCYVYYNADLSDGLPLFELHSAGRNLAWHTSQHFAIGTYRKSGLELFGYALSRDAAADLSWGLSAGEIVDEDIAYTVAQLNDDGPYVVLRRQGATAWTWTLEPRPYLTGAIYAAANQSVNGVWQMTELASGQFVNYWICATPAASEAPGAPNPKRVLVIPGQAIHNDLSAAQSASIAEMSWGELAIPEIVPLWRVTLEARNNYVSVGRVKIAAIERLLGTRASISGDFAAAGTHNALSGRDAADAHPAGAISGLSAVAVTGNYSDLTGTPKLGLDPSA